jgi:LPXTG-motif cell wall-anchored protein
MNPAGRIRLSPCHSTAATRPSSGKPSRAIRRKDYTGEPQTGWFYLENVKYPGEWLHFYYVSSSDVNGEKYDLSTQKITTFTISSANQLYTMHQFTGGYSATWYYKSITINGSSINFGFSTTEITGTTLTYKTASAANGSIAITVTNTSAGYTLPSTGGIGLAPFILAGLMLLMIPAAVLTIDHRKKRTGGGSS